MTGLSRRSSIALVVAVGLGVVASTVATTVEARGDEACPDRGYGCATFHPGEPVVVGVLFPADEPGRFGALASTLIRGTFMGRRLRVLSLDGRCSAEAASEAARELATDPPDGPPVVAVVGEVCPRAEIPVVQILDDSGITFVAALEPSLPQVPLDRYLRGPGPSADGAVHLDTPRPLGDAELAAFAATEAILEAAEEVAVEHEGALLVPRTPLRDDLVDRGLAPVSGPFGAPGPS